MCRINFDWLNVGGLLHMWTNNVHIRHKLSKNVKWPITRWGKTTHNKPALNTSITQEVDTMMGLLVQYLVAALFLTSAQKLHAVYDVVFNTGHQESTAKSCCQYGCQETPPPLCAIVTHHVVQQPVNTTHTHTLHQATSSAMEQCSHWFSPSPLVSSWWQQHTKKVKSFVVEFVVVVISMRSISSRLFNKLLHEYQRAIRQTSMTLL